MKLRSLWLLAAMAGCASQAAAQCPNTRAETVAKSITVIGQQRCSAGSLTIHGVPLGGTGQMCPLLIVDTPTHELEVYAGPEAGTRVRQTDVVKEWTYFFKCERDWIVIIPWGSRCAFDRQVIRGTLFRRITVPC